MAELKDQLRSDMKEAMKAHDQQRLAVIRAALASFMNAEVEGEAHELTTAEEQTLVTKEVRQRRDSAEILQAYLPAPLTAAAVADLIEGEFAAVEAATGAAPTMKQMGAIMKAVNAKVAGRFDGGVIATMVKGRLA